MRPASGSAPCSPPTPPRSSWAPPLLGRLSDRIGRRPVLLASLAGSAVSLVLSGLATSLVTLRPRRAPWPGSSAGASRPHRPTWPTRRRRRSARGTWASSGPRSASGSSSAPPSGRGLGALGFGTAAFVAAGLAAANLAFASSTCPRRTAPSAATRPPRGRTSRTSSPPCATRRWGGFSLRPSSRPSPSWRWRRHSPSSASTALASTPSRLGFVFTYVGVVIVVVQGGLVGPLATRFGERLLAVAGSLLMAVGLGRPPPRPGPAGGASWGSASWPRARG